MQRMYSKFVASLIFVASFNASANADMEGVTATPPFNDFHQCFLPFRFNDVGYSAQCDVAYDPEGQYGSFTSVRCVKQVRGPFHAFTYILDAPYCFRSRSKNFQFQMEKKDFSMEGDNQMSYFAIFEGRQIPTDGSPPISYRCTLSQIDTIHKSVRKNGIAGNADLEYACSFYYPNS